MIKYINPIINHLNVSVTKVILELGLEQSNPDKFSEFHFKQPVFKEKRSAYLDSWVRQLRSGTKMSAQLNNHLFLFVFFFFHWDCVGRELKGLSIDN